MAQCLGTSSALGAGMLDAILVLVTVAFFGLMYAYGRSCERL
jgi:hypothetical protein